MGLGGVPASQGISLSQSCFGWRCFAGSSFQGDVISQEEPGGISKLHPMNPHPYGKGCSQGDLGSNLGLAMGSRAGPALGTRGRHVPQPKGHPCATPFPITLGQLQRFLSHHHRARTRCTRASPSRISLRSVTALLGDNSARVPRGSDPGGHRDPRCGPWPRSAPSPGRCGRASTSRPRCTSASSTWTPSLTATEEGQQDKEEEQEEGEEEEEDPAAAPCPGTWLPAPWLCPSRVPVPCWGCPLLSRSIRGFYL